MKINNYKTNIFVLLFLFLGTLSYSQTKTLKGTVKDATTKEPIFGVAIGVKNLSVSAFTNFEGEFTITVPDTVKSVYFVMVGYKKKTHPANEVINVFLTQDAVNLDETVVTANAIKREKRSLGYSTQQVNSTELTKGQSTNVLSALQGKVSGVNITSTTGGPGTSNRIVIRGGTSIKGSNQALIVVDGIPIDNANYNPADNLNNQVDYGNRANDINPDDIENVSVLKGPAAAALYGSRASNGAIIITTKQGRKTTSENRKTDITFTSGITFSSVLKLPKTQNKFGQGDMHYTKDDRRENFSWGLPFDGEYRPWGQIINGEQRVKKYEDLPNNIKDFFVTGVAYNNNLAISGGNEKTTYFLSANSLNSKGIIETTGYKRNGIRLNATTELSNKFTSSISVNYTNINSNNPSGGQGVGSIYNNLIQTPRDIPIIAGKDLEDPFNKYDEVTGTYGFYGAYTTNPYYILKNNRNSNAVDRVQGNTTLTYKVADWLTLTERIGGDFYSDRRVQKWKKYDFKPIDSFWSGNNRTSPGMYSEDNYNVLDLTNDLMATMNKDINNSLKVYGTLGYNVRQRNQTRIFGQTNEQGGLAILDYYNLSNSNGLPVLFNRTFKKRSLGAYMDANVGYKNMVFLGVTARNDWSSTLPVNSRSFFYPSVNASFVFSELFSDSLKNGWFNYGKLRMSYAKVGNDAPEYQTSNFFDKPKIDGGFGGTTVPFGNVNAFSLGDKLGNPSITPEFTTAYELGLELNFLKERLYFDVAIFQNNSDNQIFELPLSNASGFSTKVVNAGKIQNKGVELLVRGTPVMLSNGFKVDLTGSFTKINNKVISLMDGIQQLTLDGFARMGIVARVGQPYGAFYGVDIMKDDKGRVVVDSITGIPLNTTNSQILGTYQPKFIASFGSSLSYKAFSFNFLFDTKQGGLFYSRTKGTMDFVGTAPETAEGNREDKLWPNSVYKNYKGEYVENTERKYDMYNYFTNKIPDGRHLIDASYVKLREVSFNYVLPAKYLTKTPFGGISVSLFANNVFIWTAKENTYSDPEMNSSGSGNAQGFEFSANPSQRNYGFNVKFNF